MTYTAEKFWQRVEIGSDNQCWPWLGYRSYGRRGGGYGRLDFQTQKGVYAHRVAYILANRANIPLKARAELILHRCDNPRCCNPKHLFLGTHLENMADMRSKRRSRRYKSTESPRAKLTAEDVFWIRMAKKYGATKRALALLYDVSTATISGAVYGRHYRDVPM
jgi:hypothetical protein